MSVVPHDGFHAVAVKFFLEYFFLDYIVYTFMIIVYQWLFIISYSVSIQERKNKDDSVRLFL